MQWTCVVWFVLPEANDLTCIEKMMEYITIHYTVSRRLVLQYPATQNLDLKASVAHDCWVHQFLLSLLSKAESCRIHTWNCRHLGGCEDDNITRKSFPKQSTDTSRASLPTLAASANAVLPPNGQAISCSSWVRISCGTPRTAPCAILKRPCLWFDWKRWPGHPPAAWFSKQPWTQQIHTNSLLSECFHFNQIPASCAFLTQRLRADSPAVFANETDLKLQDLQSCEILIWTWSPTRPHIAGPEAKDFNQISIHLWEFRFCSQAFSTSGWP